MKFREASQEEKHKIYDFVIAQTHAFMRSSASFKAVLDKIRKDNPDGGTFEAFLQITHIVIAEITENYFIASVFTVKIHENASPNTVFSVCNRLEIYEGKISSINNTYVTDIFTAGGNASAKPAMPYNLTEVPKA